MKIDSLINFEVNFLHHWLTIKPRRTKGKNELQGINNLYFEPFRPKESEKKISYRGIRHLIFWQTCQLSRYTTPRSVGKDYNYLNFLQFIVVTKALAIKSFCAATTTTLQSLLCKNAFIYEDAAFVLDPGLTNCYWMIATKANIPASFSTLGHDARKTCTISFGALWWKCEKIAILSLIGQLSENCTLWSRWAW